MIKVNRNIEKSATYSITPLFCFVLPMLYHEMKILYNLLTISLLKREVVEHRVPLIQISFLSNPENTPGLPVQYIA